MKTDAGTTITRTYPQNVYIHKMQYAAGFGSSIGTTTYFYAWQAGKKCTINSKSSKIYISYTSPFYIANDYFNQFQIYKTGHGWHHHAEINLIGAKPTANTISHYRSYVYPPVENEESIEQIVESNYGNNGESTGFVTIDKYDGFGQLVEKDYEGEDDWIIYNVTYTELGLPENKEVPHYRNESTLSVTYQYDAIGRPVVITNTDGTTLTYHYNLENTTITNQNGIDKTLTSDIFGNIVKVHEFNKGETYVTSYSYDAMTNLVEIIPDPAERSLTQPVDPIINGEFDGTTTGWSFDGPSFATVTDTSAHEGSYCAYINYNRENAIVNGTRITQTIQVPDVPGTLKLEFYERTYLHYWAGQCGIKFDDSWIFNVNYGTPGRRYTTTNWAKQSIDISDYKGQTVDLSIIWHDPSAQYYMMGDHVGWIRVDDIQIVQEVSDGAYANSPVDPTYDSFDYNVAMRDPDIDNRTYEYDLNGNLVNQTDAIGVSTQLTYDDFNNTTAVNYYFGDANVSLMHNLEYNDTLSKNTTITNQSGVNTTLTDDVLNNNLKDHEFDENETHVTSYSKDAVNSPVEVMPESTEYRLMQLNGDPIINGEFDGTTTGWSFEGPSFATVTDTSAYEGSYCAYINYNRENAIVNGTRIKQTIQVPDVPGNLTLEFYERTYLHNWAGQCGIKFDDNWVFNVNYGTPGRRYTTTNWAKQSINISEYKGQTVDLSIIWHDSSAQYYSYGDHVGWIRVDDIQIVQEIFNTANTNNSIYFTYDSLGRKVAMSDPDMGNWSYEYDLNGNLINQTDARGVSTRLSYDNLNRVTAIDYPSDADVSFMYDLEYNGTLSRVMKGGISSNYDYDQRYRVESETVMFGDLGYTTSYEYDSMDRVTRITYPDAASVNLTYNAQTLLESVEGVIDNIDYNARAQITTKELSNGVVTTYTYDSEKLLLDRIYTESLQDLNYEFDNVGNILEIQDNVLNSVKTYGYDDLDRLTSASMSVNSVPAYQRDFTYDQYGCIHQVDENGVTISSYEYNLTPFHAPDTYNGNTLDYDSNGNLVEDEDFIYVYNDANQLSEVRYSGNSSLVEKYWYDANGKRVKKQNADGQFSYYVNQFYEIDNGTATSYFFRDDERIAKQTAGDMEWYLSDHLGSTTLLVNESGLEVERTEYFPYGQVHSGGLEKYGFTGQENDIDTGLMYYGARYYSPEYRIFVQPDTMLPDPYNPQALNRYAYVLNNPVRYTDPSGHVPLDTIADGLFLLYDGGKYLLDQSDENKRNLEWSAASAIVPYVPGRYTKSLLKYVSPSDLSKIGKYAPDALKYLGYSDEFAYAVKRGDTIHAATNARDKTIWLAEGSVEQNWGWSHIIDSRDLGTAKNQFAEFFGSQYNDMEKCKGLIMETVEKGTYINKPGSSEAFIMKVSDDHYLKVAFNEHGSINTAIPLDGSRAEKEITKYGGKK